VTLDSSCVLLQWMRSTSSDCVSLDNSCVLLDNNCDLLDDIIVTVLLVDCHGDYHIVWM
jgi:hypothetical protein